MLRLQLFSTYAFHAVKKVPFLLNSTIKLPCRYASPRLLPIANKKANHWTKASRKDTADDAHERITHLVSCRRPGTSIEAVAFCDQPVSCLAGAPSCPSQSHGNFFPISTRDNRMPWHVEWVVSLCRQNFYHVCAIIDLQPTSLRHERNISRKLPRFNIIISTVDGGNWAT